MNEVGISNAQLQLVSPSNASSSKGAEASEKSEDGKALPKPSEIEDSLAANDEKSTGNKPEESLGEMVSTVNGYVQSIQRDLQFSVDQDLEKTVVKVVDSDSGKVIRQIPEDVFLDLARNLIQKGEFQLVDAQG